MKQTKPFYKSAAWQKCRAVVMLRDHYLCQPCLKRDRIVPADLVHHIKHLEDEPDLALDPNNLESVCNSCHNKLHPEKGSGKKEGATRSGLRVIKAAANEEVW